MKQRITKITRTAYHEAGHAVMCCWLQIPITDISIFQEGDTLGYVNHGNLDFHDIDEFNLFFDDSSRKHFDVERMVMVSFAGQAAVSLLSKRHASCGVDDDRQSILNQLIYLTRGDGKLAGAWGNYLYQRTLSMLSTPVLWKAVVRLASELLEKKVLSGVNADSIIREAMNEGFPPINIGKRGEQ